MARTTAVRSDAFSKFPTYFREKIGLKGIYHQNNCTFFSRIYTHIQQLLIRTHVLKYYRSQTLKWLNGTIVNHHKPETPMIKVLRSYLNCSKHKWQNLTNDVVFFRKKISITPISQTFSLLMTLKEDFATSATSIFTS